MTVMTEKVQSDAQHSKQLSRHVSDSILPPCIFLEYSNFCVNKFQTNR